MYYFSASLLLFAAILPINAFAPSKQHSTTKATGTTTSLWKASVDDELEDLDRVRANFEFLMHTEGLIKDDAILPLPHTPEEYTPRPLTESSRQRRELEMELIASLADSNDAIDELMALWMLERGPEAAEELHKMTTVCSPGLVEEEKILRDLLDEFGVHWAEPVSRLASVMFFKGNSAESEQWCEIAMAVKPWHFEVAHTQVLNALRNQDLAQAVRWQRKALPPLNPATNNRARKAWVKQALKDARTSMDKAEAAAMEKKPKVYVKDTDMWQ